MYPIDNMDSKRSQVQPSKILRGARYCFAGVIGAALASTMLMSPAVAQEYPTQSVSIVVPFNVGGPTDLLGRVIANALSEKLGQPFVIDNRPGATGAIGGTYAATADPDGYTLLLGSNSVNGTNEMLRPESTPYRTEEAFQAIALLTRTPFGLVVHENLGVSTLEEFLELAKASPGDLTYSTTGIGGTAHFASELLNIRAGIDTVHIPFTGGGPMMQALLAGTVDFTIGGMTGLSDGMIPLAVLWDERLPHMPDVPTMAERGINDIEYYAWFGLFAPKDTPADVIAKLEASVLEVANDPAVLKQLVDLGFEPTVEGREGLERQVRDSMAKSAAVLAENPDLIGQ
ncbi:MAG: tripartite tricarboxylate transporter substrate binding protein [Salinarimonadaceae bacterium]|nr:MAG: tripartite tricarboxylate transporter substrate binding protein [Salinarimonadaceae bacterium]